MRPQSSEGAAPEPRKRRFDPYKSSTWDKHVFRTCVITQIGDNYRVDMRSGKREVDTRIIDGSDIHNLFSYGAFSTTPFLVHRVTFRKLRHGLCDMRFPDTTVIREIEFEKCRVDLTCERFHWPTHELDLIDCTLEGNFRKDRARRNILHKLYVRDCTFVNPDRVQDFRRFFDFVAIPYTEKDLVPVSSLVSPHVYEQELELDEVESYLRANPACIAVYVFIHDENEGRMLMSILRKFPRIHVLQAGLVITEDEIAPDWLQQLRGEMLRTFVSHTPYGPVGYTVPDRPEYMEVSVHDWLDKVFDIVVRT